MINNAGILRDRIFHRMSIVDFDQVIKVHLNGAFYICRAAANHFKEQESGAFVHFTSTSGLIGNFGQANYAAAKIGIVGLSAASPSTCRASTCARTASRRSPGAA